MPEVQERRTGIEPQKAALKKVREAEVLLDQAHDEYCGSPVSEESSPGFDVVADHQWGIVRALTHALYDAMKTLEGQYQFAVTIGADREETS